MSTKSKNPSLKRITVNITRAIIKKADPHSNTGCYFYHAIKPHIKDNVIIIIGFSFYNFNYQRLFFSKAAQKFVKNGMDRLANRPNSKPVVPTSFAIYVPRKFLK